MPMIDNIIDIHVHADPSLFERNCNAKELLEKCSNYKAIVFKFHHGSSVELANILNQSSPVDVFGGVVLNEFVGGLNPMAVESAIILGAKIIWLPTIHAAFHEKACGCLGGFDFQKSKVKAPEKGISIVRNNDLSENVKEILDIMNGKPCVLASGHISPEEIKILSAYINDNKIDTKLLINHVFFSAPKLKMEDIKELSNENTYFEVSHLTVSKLTKAAQVEDVADALKRHPELNWIMVSDSGQKDGYTSPEAMEEFYSQLKEQGVLEVDLQRYMTENPSELLGLS